MGERVNDTARNAARIGAWAAHGWPEFSVAAESLREAAGKEQAKADKLIIARIDQGKDAR